MEKRIFRNRLRGWGDGKSGEVEGIDRGNYLKFWIEVTGFFWVMNVLYYGWVKEFNIGFL